MSHIKYSKQKCHSKVSIHIYWYLPCYAKLTESTKSNENAEQDFNTNRSTPGLTQPGLSLWTGSFVIGSYMADTDKVVS